ncbi:MAG TPA: TetR/AcrR family transcriptional regulator [Acidimicrobiales bacterium]|nr:TetR/AcrR family transcriptional regulator [Acidimicrobiales bacterium]
MAKQSRSAPVMLAVLEAVAERLMTGDEMLIRIPEICEATGVNYGSVYHHFGSREGVIDAAYDMIFTQLVDEDLRMFQRVNETVQSLDEYISVMQPIVAALSSGPERQHRRALRMRIAAAASTRPDLSRLIGSSQARLTKDLARLTEFAQQRQWLRDDVPAAFFAVLFQILIFGRSLDDISNEPIDEGVWGSSLSVLFMELLKQ